MPDLRQLLCEPAVFAGDDLPAFDPAALTFSYRRTAGPWTKEPLWT
ncbi:hypothetical protein [Streptomyces lydicus]|nr:hypothetical protein [Streptomyces lydicus]